MLGCYGNVSPQPLNGEMGKGERERERIGGDECEHGGWEKKKGGEVGNA